MGLGELQMQLGTVWNHPNGLLVRFDRLRVLTTELKRLIAAGAPVALRLGVGPALDQARLASALWWV